MNINGIYFYSKYLYIIVFIVTIFIKTLSKNTAFNKMNKLKKKLGITQYMRLILGIDFFNTLYAYII